jgi:hypothetical protein
MTQPEQPRQLTDQRAEYLKKGYGRSIIERAYPIWRAWDQVRSHLIGLQLRPDEKTPAEGTWKSSD